MNRIILTGHLGKDPVVSFAPGGDAVCNATLATTERWKDKQGQKKEETEWHRLVVWGKRGEAAGEWWKKGMRIEIEGRIKYKQWTDKDGSTRYGTDIIVSNWDFGGSKADNSGSNRGPSGPGQDPAGQSGEQFPGVGVPTGDLPEDQLPF